VTLKKDCGFVPQPGQKLKSVLIYSWDEFACLWDFLNEIIIERKEKRV